MAQTKRKRRTKHRGDATGAVTARGRTGRKPTTTEKGSSSRPGSTGAKADARARAREERLNKPPTWRAAINRALIAAVFLVILSLVLLKQSVVSAAILLPFVLLIYVPLGYYTDMFMYKRRMRQKQAGKATR